MTNILEQFISKSNLLSATFVKPNSELMQDLKDTWEQSTRIQSNWNASYVNQNLDQIQNFKDTLNQFINKSNHFPNQNICRTQRPLQSCSWKTETLWMQYLSIKILEIWYSLQNIRRVLVRKLNLLNVKCVNKNLEQTQQRWTWSLLKTQKQF